MQSELNFDEKTKLKQMCRQVLERCVVGDCRNIWETIVYTCPRIPVANTCAITRETNLSVICPPKSSVYGDLPIIKHWNCLNIYAFISSG